MRSPCRRASRAASWPRSPWRPGRRPAPTGSSTSSGARTRPPVPTAPCTPTSPGFAACSSPTSHHGLGRRCSSPPTTATASTSTRAGWMPSPSPARSAPATRPWRRCGPSSRPDRTPRGRAVTRWAPTSRRWRRRCAPGPERPTPTSVTTRTCWRTGPRSTSCGPPHRRTPPWACSRSASTRPCSLPPSRPGGGTRCASAPGRSRRWRWCAPGGRSRRSTCCAATASCSPTSSASTPGRRCGHSRRPCCASRRPWARGFVPRSAARPTATATPSAAGAHAAPGTASGAAPTHPRDPVDGCTRGQLADGRT